MLEKIPKSNLGLFIWVHLSLCIYAIKEKDMDVCEKDRAGDTAYTEDIVHQCKNLKERKEEEEYIVLNKFYVKHAKYTSREHHTNKKPG